MIQFLVIVLIFFIVVMYIMYRMGDSLGRTLRKRDTLIIGLRNQLSASRFKNNEYVIHISKLQLSQQINFKCCFHQPGAISSIKGIEMQGVAVIDLEVFQGMLMNVGNDDIAEAIQPLVDICKIEALSNLY